MKKNYFLGFIAFAALTMAGCSNDVNELIPQEEAIEFSSYIGRDAQTRGSVADLGTLRTDAFGVVSYLNKSEYTNTPNFMTNVKVYDSSNNVGNAASWTYDETKYWPTDETTNKLDFFAYGPYSANCNNITSVDKTILNFTVPTDVTNQTDLVVATPIKDVTKTTYTNGVVPFTFNHVLSRIAFYAKSSGYNQTTIVINSISLTGDFHETGTVNLSVDPPAISGLDTDEITYTPELNTTNTTLTTEFEMQNAETEYLMVIPNSTAANYTLSVTYTVTTADSEPVENTIEKNISNQIFAAGKAYAINLDIALNAIGFSVTVSPWKDAEDDGEGEDDFKEIVVTPAS